MVTLQKVINHPKLKWLFSLIPAIAFIIKSFEAPVTGFPQGSFD